MNLLEIKALQYLGSQPIDFKIKTHEIMGLSGSSGSGKSRLIRAIADLDEHLGSVQLDGVNQLQIMPHLWRKQVALLVADSRWWFDTVSEHFENLQSTQYQSLGFSEDISQWAISKLSSGEKQRLALLRLLENKPDVLLLDEPTANLDMENTLLFESFVSRYLKENSACAIWVSHDKQQLDRISNRQFEMVNGALKNVD